MLQNSYNNIKKYMTFIFFVFTVLSGSSDRFAPEGFVKTGGEEFADLLAAREMYIQNAELSPDSSNLAGKVSKNDDMRELSAVNAEALGLDYEQLCKLLPMPQVCCINNPIVKNSIWKSAVF